jgi:hypothetical protein
MGAARGSSDRSRHALTRPSKRFPHQHRYASAAYLRIMRWVLKWNAILLIAAFIMVIHPSRFPQ